MFLRLIIILILFSNKPISMFATFCIIIFNTNTIQYLLIRSQALENINVSYNKKE